MQEHGCVTLFAHTDMLILVLFPPVYFLRLSCSLMQLLWELRIQHWEV